MVNRITQVYRPAGLDLVSAEMLRNQQFARDGKNFLISRSGDLIRFPGNTKKDTAVTLGYGLTVYNQRIPTQVDAEGWGEMQWGVDSWGSPTSQGLGQIEKKLVSTSSSPSLWTPGTIEVTKSGSGGIQKLTIRANTSGTGMEYAVETVSGSESVVAITSSMTATQLATSISTVSGLSATVATGDGTQLAQFINKELELDVSDSGSVVELHFGTFDAINTTLDDPMPSTESRVLEEDYELPQSISYQGVLYTVNGYDDMHKFDGQTFYKAGLPTASSPSLAVDTGTAAPAGMDGVYSYRISYVQVDNVGNLIESAISTISADADNSAGPYAIDVTVGNIEDGTGYNTNGALTSSTHTSTNIATDQEQLSVDDGAGGAHSLKVGDNAYFYEKNSATYVTYKVLAVTSSTITLDASSTLSVDDNMPISNNLKIAIYRTAAGASTYNLVAEIPNDAYNSTQDYSDIIADSALGADLPNPLHTPGVPPKCKYITQWNNDVWMGGNPDDPTLLYYSDNSSGSSTHANAENFPFVNSIRSASSGSSTITGLSALGDNLIVFYDDSISVVSGNSALRQLSIEQITNSVGCISASTIKKFGDSLYFLDKNGLYMLSYTVRGIEAQLLSRSIDPLFTSRAIISDMTKNLTRTSMVRANAEILDNSYYILSLPQETTALGRKATNTDSISLVLDLQTGEWFPNDLIKSSGGLVNFENNIWWVDVSNVATPYLKHLNRSYTELDYVDHDAAYSTEFVAQWDKGGTVHGQKVYYNASIESYRNLSDLAFTSTGAPTIDLFYNMSTSSTISFDSYLRGDYMPVVEPLPEQECSAISIKFSNDDINQNLIISGWSYGVKDYRTNIRRLR